MTSSTIASQDDLDYQWRIATLDVDEWVSVDDDGQTASVVSGIPRSARVRRVSEQYDMDGDTELSSVPDYFASNRAIGLVPSSQSFRFMT